MKSHVYLNPMTPDGKPGEVKEIVYEGAGSQQFLAPVSYAANDDTAKLRHAVTEARAKLRHAVAKKAPAGEIQKLQAAFDAAKAAVGQAHYDQQQQRIREQSGGDSPFSRGVKASEVQMAKPDTRQFAEVVSYVENDYDGNDTTGRTFDDESDDELEAQILAAVTALETAQSNGAPWAEVLRLEAALKVLRDQLPNPSAPPAQTTAAPARKAHIERPAPPHDPASQALVKTPAVKAPTKKPTGTWDDHLKEFDKRLAKKALASIRRDVETTKASPSIHAADVCCEGAYKCARCKAKAAAA